DSWPPQDPYAHEQEESISLSNRLKGGSPWTYGNEEFNPRLQPSNRTRRNRRSNGFQVPPYHFNYSRNEEFSDYSDPDSSSSQVEMTLGPRRRMGSDGFEVEPIDRDE